MKQIIKMNRSTKWDTRSLSRIVSLHHEQQTSPAGATLIEILMSLMVMAVGLVSVATLFPISMLRSIQATQLTNAVLLKFQCEEYVQALPELGRNDFDSTYLTTDNLVGNLEFSNRSVAWKRHSVANVAELKSILPLNAVSVIDPIGVSYNSGANGKTYGKDPHNLHTITSLYYAVDRKNAGFDFGNTAHEALAFSMFASNDSWKTFLSSEEVTVGSTTTVTLADADPADLAEFFASLTGSLGRIVLIDNNKKQSHISPVTGITGNVVTFSSPLPSNGLYNAITEVRLEIFEPRYSCMITLRKQLVSLGSDGAPGVAGVDDDNSDGDNNPATGADGSGEIGWAGSDDDIRTLGGDLVVFFRRDFSPLAEQVYGVENLNKGQVGVQPQEVRIRWGSGDDVKPRIREGGYVFDSRNGYWYQIRTIIAEDRAATNSGVPWIDDATNDRESVVILDRSPEATVQFLMVPENVVEVFDFTAF